MFGLDQSIARLAHGHGLLVLVVAVLLGLRHATDPDHLTAVTTLLAGERGRVRRAARLGLTWGIGHATALLAFGVPIVLFRSYLPEPVQRAAEVTVGLVIVALSIRLLVRHRRPHTHPPVRSNGQAFAIGLVHGTGGSAGIGVLLLAAIPSRVEALVALGLFALCTAISMALASSAVGLALGQRRLAALTPLLAVLALLFGAWYALNA